MNNETQQITVGEAYTTTDREWALTLLTAGCQLARAELGGPAQMHYTPEICRNRWLTRRDPSTGHPTRVPLMSHYDQTPYQFEQAVMKAVDKGIPGEVNWFIVRDDIFREAVAMQDALAKAAYEADMAKIPMVFPPFHTLTETQAVICALYARRKNSRDMDSYQWLRVPNLATGYVRKNVVPIDGRSDIPKEVLNETSYTVEGHGMVWSLNLSDEKRAQKDAEGKPYLHPKPKKY